MDLGHFNAFLDECSYLGALALQREYSWDFSDARTQIRGGLASMLGLRQSMHREIDEKYMADCFQLVLAHMSSYIKGQKQ